MRQSRPEFPALNFPCLFRGAIQPSVNAPGAFYLAVAKIHAEIPRFQDRREAAGEDEETDRNGLAYGVAKPEDFDPVTGSLILQGMSKNKYVFPEIDSGIFTCNNRIV